MLRLPHIAVGSVLLGALSILAIPRLTVAEETPAQQLGPKVVGILFYAEWCASCKVLEPKLNDVKKEYVDKPIYFTRVDLTDEGSKAQSQLFAQWVGLEGIYKENVGKTGFMLLIDPKEKKVLSKLTKDQSETEIKQAIDQALAGKQ